jgi:hypothetical protein
MVESAKLGEAWQNGIVTPTGAELSAFSSGNKGVSLQSGAKTGALSGISYTGGEIPTPIAPDLLEVVDAWLTLSATARMNILAIIRQEGQI